MKKQLIIETLIMAITLSCSVLLYIAMFGQPALYEKTLDITVHDTYFQFYKSLVITQIWLIQYFFINMIRQFWLKFKNQGCNMTLSITILFLSLFLYGYIQLVSDAGAVLINGKLTIYPPLSAIPHQSTNNLSGIRFLINSLWAIEFILWSIAVLTIILAIKNKKK